MIPFSLLLLYFVQFSNSQVPQSQQQQQQNFCVRDVEEDVCPQREGFDEECDRRCAQLYPMRIGSGCRTRQTGTLLSFFGIRSFVCTCHLSPIACANPQFAIHPYHSAVVQQHSYLSQIPAFDENTAKGSANLCGTQSTLSCRDDFQPPQCTWKYSKEFQWFSAQSNGSPAPRESPVGRYLAGASNSGATWSSISTCDGLCSKTSVNFTARVWRPPTSVVELCFKEKETTMCAPVHSSNGHLINEIIPETDFFQIMLRFSNVSAGEMILIDDLTVGYGPCSAASAAPVVSTPSSMHSEEVKLKPQGLGSSIHNVPHRMCLDGECPDSPPHSASHVVSSSSALKLPPNHHTKMCIGRNGLAYCRQKCQALDASETSARCIRQKDNPLVKKCICHVRRSPVRKIDGPMVVEPASDSDVDAEKAQRMEITTTSTPLVAAKQNEVENENENENGEEVESNRVLAEETSGSATMMMMMTPESGMESEDLQETTTTSKPSCDQTLCDLQCNNNPKSSKILSPSPLIGECLKSGDCRCKKNECSESNCTFEKNGKCGWADLRMLSRHFNNISVAMKKGDENRYGISRLRPKSYSGLLYKSSIVGPISMSIDIFPSHEIDVRICVQNLRKCQTQTIAARSWNRVSAKIKVQRTEKIFVLFYNSSQDPKSIAIDNIIVRNGACL